MNNEWKSITVKIYSLELLAFPIYWVIALHHLSRLLSGGRHFCWQFLCILSTSSFHLINMTGSDFFYLIPWQPNCSGLPMARPDWITRTDHHVHHVHPERLLAQYASRKRMLFVLCRYSGKMKPLHCSLIKVLIDSKEPPQWSTR